MQTGKGERSLPQPWAAQPCLVFYWAIQKHACLHWVIAFCCGCYKIHWKHVWLERHIKLQHHSVHFFALFCFDLTGQRRHFNEELWHFCSFLVFFNGLQACISEREQTEGYYRVGLSLAKSPQMVTQGSIPPSKTFSTGLWQGDSSLGKHLVSGQYLMRNSIFLHGTLWLLYLLE